MSFRQLRFVNAFILGVIAVLLLSGVWMLFWAYPAWLFEVHRLSGWALIASVPLKTRISLRSLRRGFRADFDRGLMTVISLLAAALTILILALGLAWSFRLGPEKYWLRQTAISWHWILSLALIIPFALHAWWRWPRPRHGDLLSRRAILRLLVLGVIAIGGWWLGGWIGKRRDLVDSPSRYTGSRLNGYMSGNDFPVTHALAPSQDEIDIERWKLTVEGDVSSPLSLNYAQLQKLPTRAKTAELDCTLGWYSVQEWEGIPLVDLLEMARISRSAFAVRLESVTGYAQILPLEEARNVILATYVCGELLDFWHGFPLRAVVPSRRGWFWVKWLSRVEVIAL